MMSSELNLAASVSPRFSLPRFPTRWAVESAAAEGVFARLLWLLVPLQYYVVTNIGRGLSSDDLVPAVILSLASVVVIFLLSCLAAWLSSVLWPPRPEQDDNLTRRVRMWVTALMISTAAAYFLLALSLLATHVAITYGVPIYDDLVTDRLMWLLDLLGYSWEDMDGLAFRRLLLALASLIYASIGLLLIVCLRWALRRGPPRPALPHEPDLVSVGVITSFLMFAVNSLAVLD
jgi:hypothetical protein